MCVNPDDIWPKFRRHLGGQTQKETRKSLRASAKRDSREIRSVFRKFRVRFVEEFLRSKGAREAPHKDDGILCTKSKHRRFRSRLHGLPADSAQYHHYRSGRTAVRPVPGASQPTVGPLLGAETIALRLTARFFPKELCLPAGLGDVGRRPSFHQEPQWTVPDRKQPDRCGGNAVRVGPRKGQPGVQQSQLDLPVSKNTVYHLLNGLFFTTGLTNRAVLQLPGWTVREAAQFGHLRSLLVPAQ